MSDTPTIAMVDDRRVGCASMTNGHRYARVRAVSWSIPRHIYLRDVAGVTLVLLEARLCSADFSDVLDEAVELTRALRAS